MSKVITTFLEKNRVPTDIRATFPIEDIIAKKAAGAEKEKLLQKSAQLALVTSALELDGRGTPDYASLLGINPKVSDAVIRDLIAQKLLEYYFLESTDVGISAREGYVVLLRNMQTMPISLMQRIAGGLELDPACGRTPFDSVLKITQNSLCMITGVLRSPDIEHLAQQFANLFVRIGLEDHQDGTIHIHLAIAKNV